MLRGRFVQGSRRLYSSSTDKTKQSWTQLKSSFETSRSGNTVEIAPRLQPRFQPGQTTYEPSDFSLAKRRYDATARAIAGIEGRNDRDRFAKLGVDPLELWKSPKALSEFVTSNGKIMPGWVLGNRGSTQKKLSKAIRRCRAAGLLSTVHRSVFDSA